MDSRKGGSVAQEAIDQLKEEAEKDEAAVEEARIDLKGKGEKLQGEPQQEYDSKLIKDAAVKDESKEKPEVNVQEVSKKVLDDEVATGVTAELQETAEGPKSDIQVENRSNRSLDDAAPTAA